MVASLALFEAGLIFAAACAAILSWTRPFAAGWPDIASLIGQALVVSLFCMTAFYYSGLYDFRIVRTFSRFVSRLPLALLFAIMLVAALCMLPWETGIDKAPLLLSPVAVVGLLVLFRAVFYGVLRSRFFVKRVLILGMSPLAERLIEEIDSQPHCRYVIAGIVDNVVTSRWPFSRYPFLGPLEHLQKIIQEVRPDGIIVALTERAHLPTRQLLECRLEGIFVEDGVEVYERLAEKLAIEWHTPGSLIFSKDFRKSRLDLVVGRAVSLLASIVGLIVFAPLFGLIALAIKLESSGPVLFVQERVGLNGRPFRLLKFRTMRAASRKTSEWVRDNGDRITRLGKWLRKFRFDELPQFVNILRGDMNLVGPRPHPMSNFELFVLVLRNAPESGEEIPYYSLRSVVRPGITGWAQVRYGYANDLHEEIEKMRYDLYYVKHISLWFDLRILLDTIKTVIFGLGSQAADAYEGGKQAGRSYGEIHKAA